MNTSENNTIHMTDDEWNKIDVNGKERIKGIAPIYTHDASNQQWRFLFYGISDKQVAIELCAYFGLKVTV